MKRIAALLTALVAMLAVGCSANSDEPRGGTDVDGQEPAPASSVMTVLDDDMLALYENRDTELPVAVVYIFQGNGVRVESPLYGEVSVNAALDAIAEITVASETNIAVADSDTSYTFINANGKIAGSIYFNGDFLDCGDKRYEVNGKRALAAIDFPAASGNDSLTIDGPDPKLAEFLERCKTEKPVSVKVTRDGSERVLTDADTIREAVNALYAIGFNMYAMRGAEPPSTTLTVAFVMSDGAEYSLTFHDDVVYAYEYPAPLGQWSFYTYGAEYLIEVLEGNSWGLFLKENNSFE